MGRTCPVSSRLDSALVRYFLRHAYESKAQPRFRRSPARRHRPPPDRRAAGGGAALPRRAGPPGRALVPRRGRAIEPAGGGGSDPRLPRGDRPPRGGLRAQRRDPHPARAAGAAQGRRRRARHARDRPVRPRDGGGLLRDARPRPRRRAPGGGHRPLRDLRPDDVVDRAVVAGAGARRQPRSRLTTRSSTAGLNESLQSRGQRTVLPATRAATSSTRAAAAPSAAAIASTPGAAAIRLAEIACSFSSVLFSKVLVTVTSPADAISSGTRLGCGVYMSERPTSWRRMKAP